MNKKEKAKAEKAKAAKKSSPKKRKPTAKWLDPKAVGRENLNIVQINDSDNLSDDLGITRERLEQIAVIMDEAKVELKGCQCTTKRLEIISKKLLHANELAYVCFVEGVTYQKMSNPFGGFGGFAIAIPRPKQ